MLWTQALCRPGQVRSRTDNKDEVLEGKFVNWAFRLLPKRQLNILLNFFFPLIKLFLTFVVSAKTRVTMRFRAQNVGYSTRLSQVCAFHIGDPVVPDGRTVKWLLRHYQNFLACDRLPNLLSNDAPLARYARRLRYDFQGTFKTTEQRGISNKHIFPER